MIVRNCSGGIVFSGDKVLIVSNDKHEWGFPKGAVKSSADLSLSAFAMSASYFSPAAPSLKPPSMIPPIASPNPLTRSIFCCNCFCAIFLSTSEAPGEVLDVNIIIADAPIAASCILDFAIVPHASSLEEEHCFSAASHDC